MAMLDEVLLRDSRDLVVDAGVVRRGTKFVPVIILDGDRHYFASPLPDADHVVFKNAVAAAAHSAAFLGELRKILKHELQAGGFIIPAEDGDA